MFLKTSFGATFESEQPTDTSRFRHSPTKGCDTLCIARFCQKAKQMFHDRSRRACTAPVCEVVGLCTPLTTLHKPADVSAPETTGSFQLLQMGNSLTQTLSVWLISLSCSTA